MDKLELRVPSETQFSTEFARIYRDTAGDPKIFRPSLFYTRVGDLRKLGYHSMLHVHCQMDRRGNHKLELIDVGKLSFREAQEEICRIFDVEPTQLQIMRIDLAADVVGVPVPWFVRNARVNWKQWSAEMGEIEFALMGKRRVETLYLGKRPNCYRFYDKIAELRYQYDRMLRKASDAAEIPNFGDFSGYPETGIVLTRVERQIAAGRVPKPIQKIGDLRRLPEFNPFARLQLLASPSEEPNMEQFGMKYFTGIGLRAKADEIGLQRLRYQLNAVSAGNASRVFREYAAFLPSGLGIDEYTLFQKYRASVIRQLAA